MNAPQDSFLAAARNVHSQYGEDGVLEWTLNHLSLESGTFVEFGAWDGKHLSNCRHLFESGWSGCFIEGEADRFEDLKRTYGDSDRTWLIHAFVRTSGTDRLDGLLERAGVPTIDLLSIDIDSDDLAVWRSVEAYRPAVVIIEFNLSIPFDTRYENPPGKNHGNGALSLVELGAEKGYDLVAGTRGNLVFVDREKRPDTLPVLTLQELKDSVGGGFRFFFAFDGTLLREASRTIRDTEVYRVPWSSYMAAQPVPKFLRTFDERYRYKKILSAGILLVTRPFAAVRMYLSERANPRPEEENIY